MNEPIVFIEVVTAMLAIVYIYKRYADKQSDKDWVIFKAKVALNPELYYVSQGGLIPDPIPEPEVEPVAVQE